MPVDDSMRVRRGRRPLCVLGIGFALIAAWLWLTRAPVPPQALPGCAALAALFLAAARWAPERWVRRLQQWLTGW